MMRRKSLGACVSFCRKVAALHVPPVRPAAIIQVAWLADRVRAHVFDCMLAYYLEWHMRQRLAPMLYDDADKDAGEAQRSSIVAKAERSPAAVTKQTTVYRSVQAFSRPGGSARQVEKLRGRRPLQGN